jgi:TolA-binding protein
MNNVTLNYRYLFHFLTLLFSLFNSSICAAANISQAIEVDASRTKTAKTSQTRVDKMDDQQHRLAQQYRQMLSEIDNLAKYNDYLRNVVDSQQKEAISLQQQVHDLEETQHEIVPLMLSMMTMLHQFIAADIPFLAEERNARLAKLDQTMARADMTISEKFRQILEAYQIENDYGYTIEAYRGVLDIDGQTNPVDFFRLGRVAMFYQTLDGKKTGAWNQGATQWEALPDSYQRPIRQGLRIARKETAPDMLILSVPTAETEQ